MQETRAKTNTGGGAQMVTHDAAHAGQLAFARAVHVEVSQQAHIVAAPGRGQVRTQHIHQLGVRARGLTQARRVLGIGVQQHTVFFEEVLLGRQVTIALVGIGQRARLDLGGFHIGLVERMDADDRTSDSRRVLPTEELGAQMEDRGHIQTHHGMTRGRQGSHGRIHARVTMQAHMHEHAIGAIGLRSGQRLAIHRHDAQAHLAGRLGHQLLQPRAQARETCRGMHRQLVLTMTRTFPEENAQSQARVARAFRTAARGQRLRMR